MGCAAIGAVQDQTGERTTPLDRWNSSRHASAGRTDVTANARVTLNGVISRPVVSGEVSLDEGAIRPSGGLLSRLRQAGGSPIHSFLREFKAPAALWRLFSSTR